MKPSADTKVDNMRPLAADTLPLTNLKGHRVRVFWSLEITGMIHFICRLIVAGKVVGLSVSFGPSAAGFSLESQQISSSNATILLMTPLRGGEGLLIPLYKAIGELAKAAGVGGPRYKIYAKKAQWMFGLGFVSPYLWTPFAVVLTCNRAFIRVFHNAVSQRLVFVASLILWALWCQNVGPSAFVSRYPVAYVAGGLLLYVLLASALDRYEVRTVFPGAAARPGTFPQYSKSLGLLLNCAQ
ncbi:uncharacterized protein BO66DRAFT_438141 [Aspergillus aculeatinus CBS 121060]|uniref:Uncharacterized protein n=1 Tax=Aspergillus aculeatinus CBS 121060 TaxID=1448322 RepID=A0ACD1HAQ9_9EURO|nr:hypothetical protein BO66DRAFT_438141 [Aspergillus aculeatinus CBS 121060]RAH70513.1 hypothetical protein BO66DRAFT_438141 [Aspergillus aculeatinus CBS 121060]